MSAELVVVFGARDADVEGDGAGSHVVCPSPPDGASVTESPPTPARTRLRRLVDPDDDAPLEVALFRRMATLVVVVMIGVVIPTNRLLGLPLVVDAVAFVLGLVSAFFVWRSRRGRHHMWTFWSMNLVSLDLAFFVSFGVDGSVLAWFYPLTSLTVAMFHGRRRIAALVVIALDALALLAVEFTRPELVAQPISRGTRFEDLFTGHLSALVTTMMVVGLVLSAYHREQGRREAANRALAGSRDELRTLRGLLSVCGWCRKIRTDSEEWVSLERYVATRTEASFTHGICPTCMERHFGEDPVDGGAGGV